MTKPLSTCSISKLWPSWAYCLPYLVQLGLHHQHTCLNCVWYWVYDGHSPNQPYVAEVNQKHPVGIRSYYIFIFFFIILNQGCEHGEVGALVWVLQGSSRQNIGLIVKNKCESKCDKGDVQWIMLMNVDPFIWLGTFKWTVNEHFGETKTNGLVPGLPTMLCPWGIDYVTGQWSVLNSPERSPWLLDHHLYHSPFSLPSQSPISLLSLDLLKSLYPLTVYISLHKSHKVCVVYVL